MGLRRSVRGVLLVIATMTSSGTWFAEGQAVTAAQPSETQKASPVIRELNLLGTASFTRAAKAVITVRVYDRAGRGVRNLDDTAFKLTVNGTLRVAVVKRPSTGEGPSPPMVLIVFPPNQRDVHALAVREAQQYVGALSENLQWKMALLDADGTVTSYTQTRSVMLARLDALARKTEPWMSGQSWLEDAQVAVSQMREYKGSKVLLVVNRSMDEKIDEGRRGLELGGPETLVDVAFIIGAPIYIANVGGPGVLVPGEETHQWQVVPVRRMQHRHRRGICSA